MVVFSFAKMLKFKNCICDNLQITNDELERKLKLLELEQDINAKKKTVHSLKQWKKMQQKVSMLNNS